MSSYLSIYLQKKKKEGEEQEERLLLCSISRANELYNLFYENRVGKAVEDNLYEFTCEDLSSLIIGIDEAIARVMSNVHDMKENLSYISNKEVIREILDDISADKECIKELFNQKAEIETMSFLFEDVGTDYCPFDKLYWCIE